MSTQGILLERAGAKLTYGMDRAPRTLFICGKTRPLGKCKAGSIVTDLRKLSPPDHCNSISPNIIGHMDIMDIFDQPLQWSTDTTAPEAQSGILPMGGELSGMIRIGRPVASSLTEASNYLASKQLLSTSIQNIQFVHTNQLLLVLQHPHQGRTTAGCNSCLLITCITGKTQIGLGTPW